MFIKRLVDLKNDKVSLKIFPKTNEEYISVIYGCIKFIDKFEFLSETLDKLVKNLDSDDFIILKRKFQIKGKIWTKNSIPIPLFQ